jgi:hypothetical protein
MTTSGIGEAARIAYAAGIDPLDHAEHEIALLITAHFTNAEAAGTGLCSGSHLTIAAMTRRVLGSLLNAGWRLPDERDPTEGP